MRIVEREWKTTITGDDRVVVRIDPPPPRLRVRADLADHPLTGSRVVVVDPYTITYDVRAVSEPEDGFIVVADEAIWYYANGSPIPEAATRKVHAGRVWTD